VKQYLITIRDGEDGWLVAECPELPGCVSQGKTLNETLGSIREAVEVYLETREGQLLQIEVDPPSSRAVVK